MSEEQISYTVGKGRLQEQVRAGLLMLSQAWESFFEEELPTAEQEVCNALKDLSGPKIVASSNMMYYIARMMLDPPKEVLDKTFGAEKKEPYIVWSTFDMQSLYGGQKMKKNENVHPQYQTGVERKQWYLQPIQRRFGTLKKNSNSSRHSHTDSDDKHRVDRTRFNENREI